MLAAFVQSTAELLKAMLPVLIALLPLLAAGIGFMLRGSQARIAAWAAILASLGSAASAVYLLRLPGPAVWSAPWISLPGATEIPLAFHATPAVLLFSLTTALISIAVIVFALRERRGDPRAVSFFATLALFSGAMQLFLVADTLLLIYFAWELMGVCSYLLIAHPGTQQAHTAARRAFWTTRATDFGLLFAILIWMGRFDWIKLSQLTRQGFEEYGAVLAGFAANNGLEFQPLLEDSLWWLGLTLVLVILAVAGKSALLPLSFWLPDAMVAPAPVSALLHAATMVAAGPLLLYQIGELFFYSEAALILATLLGALSLLGGGVMALCSSEPKRILAYSTVSHLGLAVLGAGVLAGEAGYVHLLAHAWFKAALFIGVGILASQYLHAPGAAVAKHAASLKDLAGSAAGRPLIQLGLVLAGLSLAGVWGLGGYFGKESILQSLLFMRQTQYQETGLTLAAIHPIAAACWNVASVMLILSMAVTAAYIVRLVGTLVLPAKLDSTPENQPDAPRSGWAAGSLALLLLALMGSLGLGLAWPGLKQIVATDATAVISGKGALGLLATVIGMLFVLLGGGLTWYLKFANPAAGERVGYGDSVLAGLKRFFGEGMYLREFWLALANRGGMAFASLSAGFERGAVERLSEGSGRLGRKLSAASAWTDNSIVDGARYWVCEVCWILKRLFARTWQTGRIQHYMFIILVAAVVLCYFIARPMAEQVTPAIVNFIEEGLL